MRTLVIVAHPGLNESSRIHTRLTAELIRSAGDVTVRDLYAVYPDERIDVEAEQQLMLAHDRIILQFPFWWYSAPPLLKKWLDAVLTFGWAYGPGGDKLHGQEWGLAISTGSAAQSYGPEGYNRFTMMEMTRPYQATFQLIGVSFLPLFVLHGAAEMKDEELDRAARAYAAFVKEPVDGMLQEGMRELVVT